MHRLRAGPRGQTEGRLGLGDCALFHTCPHNGQALLCVSFFSHSCTLGESPQSQPCTFVYTPARLPQAWPRETPTQRRISTEDPAPSPELRPLLGRAEAAGAMDRPVPGAGRAKAALCWLPAPGTVGSSRISQAPGGAAGAASMHATSGPESSDSCDHFSYFKPLSTKKLLVHPAGSAPSRVSQRQGSYPARGWPVGTGLFKGRGFHFCVSSSHSC